MATDPVCGMTVSPDSLYRHVHDGQTYLFCSAKCLAKFQESPPAYIGTRPPSPPSAMSGKVTYTCPMHPEIRLPSPGDCPKCGMALEPVEQSAIKSGTVEYTCPMHPEVVRSGPGSCPICGMALEPRNAPAEDNAELRDMTRRFWVSVALALPVFVMAMGSDLVPQAIPGFVSMRVLQWFDFALATPVVLWAGSPIFRRGWASVVNRSLNMFSLIALGVGVAWSYSVVAMLLPGIFPPAMRGMGDTVHVYFEAAAVIMALVLLGQVMELRARSQTSAAIRLLRGLAPKAARIVRPPLPTPLPQAGEGAIESLREFLLNSSEEDIPLEQVHPNDVLRVRPGE